MVELNSKELVALTGGSSKWGIGIVIGIVGTFLAGVLDGFIRPLRCN